MIIGLAIILIGIIWLFSANGLLDSQVWDSIWALVVIGFGFWLIARSRREKPWWHFFDNQSREDWERWGKEFGGRMERWGKSFGQEATEHSKEYGQELGRHIEDSIKKMFNTKTDGPVRQSEADQENTEYEESKR